jgi:hypothetical protein
MPLAYKHTLVTVWEFAFGRLSPEAIFLLDMLAFLDAVKIPRKLFDNDGVTDQSQGSVFSSRTA